MTDLWKKVQSDLLPYLSQEELEVTHRGTHWGFETVDLNYGDAIIRIAKERSPYEILFSSSADPTEWFTATEVTSYIEATVTSLNEDDIDVVLQGLRLFLETRGSDIRRVFDRRFYPETRQILLDRRQAARRHSWRRAD
jgi:hypothetical protein